jgi:glycosyltransferase involved in cell wall biosynthesis
LELNNLSYKKTGLGNRIFKYLERIGHREATFTIALDEERAKILFSDNKIVQQDLCIVPVSAYGAPYKQKSNYFQKKFNLDKEKKIILYAGSITADWTMCLEVAKEAKKFDDHWVMVFHGPRHDKNYLNKLLAIINNSEKVKISTDWVPYERLDEIISSADIGIALYRDYCLNTQLIGSASGKIAHYLKCGIPIITNNFPSIKKVIDDYKCGIAINNIDDISFAVKEILRNRDIFRQNAFKCYNSKYNFTKYFKEVIDRIESSQKAL